MGCCSVLFEGGTCALRASKNGTRPLPRKPSDVSGNPIFPFGWVNCEFSKSPWKAIGRRRRVVKLYRRQLQDIARVRVGFKYASKAREKQLRVEVLQPLGEE